MLPDFMLGRELNGSVSVVSGRRGGATRRPENDTASNLARIERHRRSLRLSCARRFRSRQPRESYPYWIFGKLFPGLAQLARQLGQGR
jgi:hypothetical protein